MRKEEEEEEREESELDPRLDETSVIVIYYHLRKYIWPTGQKLLRFRRS
jgi:hypothetical protein